MKGITHKQARRYLLADLDDLLTDDQRRDLETHLAGCEICHAESQSFASLTSRLQTEFHLRYDAQDGPSNLVLKNIQSRSRRIIMQKRIDTALNIFGGAITIAVIAFLAISLIVQFRNKSASTASGTQTSNPILGGQPYTGLLAFTSEQDGNAEIYTIHADGSGKTNLTHNSANDSNPLWTPDGKRIVFESDRTGNSQLYAMNADGSNVIQITSDSAEHHLTFMGDYRYNLWSPDGSKLLFLQKDNDSGMNSLFSIKISNRTRILLASDARYLDNFSWSPNGEYVGYILWNQDALGGFHPEIHIVDAAGNNPKDLSKFVPQDEDVFTPYFWSADGRSMIFPAENYKEQNETIYQLDPQTSALQTLMTTKPMLYDWFDGVTLAIDSHKNNQPLFWQRPDGTSAELNIYNNADPVSCYIGKARSLQGNLIVGSYCRNDDMVSLYWTNADGRTIQQLPDVQVPIGAGALTNLSLSPDEKFLTFNFRSPDESILYIWDVETAHKDYSIRPIKLTVANQDQYSMPAWQPWVENAAEEEPAPVPTVESVSSESPLLAFTSDQNGNLDIYTIHANGSALTNITNDLARDANPAWSSDGNRIAFTSDRNGNDEIFTMLPDGSDLTQLTNSPGRNIILGWSPDGTRIASFAALENDPNNGQIIVMDADGSHKTSLTEVGTYYFQGWSPIGQTIVYVKPNMVDQTFKDLSVIVVNVDGSNQQEWLFDNFETLRWEDAQHFLGVVRDNTTNSGKWTLYRFNTDGSYQTLPSYDAPLAGSFEKSIVVEKPGALQWFSFEDPQTPLAEWRFSTFCEAPANVTPQVSLSIAPDLTRAVAVLTCKDSKYLYLVNADGKEISQLGGPLEDSSEILINWLSGENYATMLTFEPRGASSASLHLLDIQSMQNNAAAQPILLTADAVNPYAILKP